MRACQPVRDGYVERDGVRVFWERYGQGEPTFLLPPTYEIVHSRSWKCQIPHLSRHGRVVTFDPRGNGRSDRPRDYAAYTAPRSPPTPWPSWTPPAPSGRSSWPGATWATRSSWPPSTRSGSPGWS
jgi:pimeloyl-ACP methyl ester carboxylesterase